MSSVMAEETMGLCPMRYNEDFDFDVDLTPPLEDEDNFIEDTDSVELSDTSQAYGSPAGNESLMNDDFDSENIKEVEEYDAPRDSKISKRDNDTTSMANKNDLNIDVIQKDSEPVSDQIYQEYTWRNQQEDSINELSGNDVTTEEIWRNDERLAENTNDYLEQESKVSPPDNEDLQDIHSPEQLISATQAPLSLQAVASDDSEGHGMIEEIKQSRLPTPSTPIDSQNYLSKGETYDEILDLSTVTVLYQLNEYPLFASSETDDPNTFFIKDHTIARKPLSDFFRAIREVVREDLDDESELFLSIPELGLQVEETSSLVENVTILELVGLRKNLALNDGVHMPQPMYIDLGTRKNFLKELTRITKLANEGKGLSELLALNDSGEDDTGEDANDSVNEGGSPPPCQNHFQNDEGIIDEEPEENDSSIQTACTNETGIQENEELYYSEKALEPNPDQRQQTHNDQHYIATGDMSASQASLETLPTEVFSDETSTLIQAKSKDLSRVSGCFYDAETDIIDYSEDEFEHGKESAIYTPLADNDYNTDPNLNSNQNIAKPSIITDEELKNTLFSNVNISINECNSFTLGNKSKFFDQNDDNSRNNIDLIKNNEHQASHAENDGQQKKYLEKNSGSSDDPNTDLSIQVDIPSEGHQSQEYHLNTVELNFFGEQDVEDGESASVDGIECKESPDQHKMDISYSKIGDFPTEDKSILSHEIKDEITKTSASIPTTDVSKAFKGIKTSSDHCSGEYLVDHGLQQNISHLDTVFNGEDEIDYDEDEEEYTVEEFKFKTNDVCSNLSRQTIAKAITSTNSKRSRTDYILEFTMDKRDLKRTRS